MHPLKFVEPSKIRAIQMEGAVLVPACQEPLEVFRENIRLVLGLVAVPGFSALLTTQWADAGTNAAMAVYGGEYASKMKDATPAETEQHCKLTIKEMEQIVRVNRPNLSRNLEFMTRQLEQHMMSCGPYVHGIFEGLLKTVCIQAWAAVEVLFEDLFMKVVVAHAPLFQHVAGGKYYFRKLSDTRKWYDRAFRGDPTICGIFDGHDFGALAEIRHLLVHKAGKVDGHFKLAASRILTLAPYLNHQLGSPLQFDGEMVRSYVDPATSKAYGLIQAVDHWLTSQSHAQSVP